MGPVDRARQEAQDTGAGPSVARSASVVGLAVLSSRVLGLVRETVFAAFFGAGAAFDAFVTAFRIPNLFRDLFAEGALSAAFVKTFSQTLDRHGEARAWRLASLVFSTLAAVVTLLVLAGMLAAPWIVAWIAPGFDAAKQALAVHLTRVMFPFLLLVALAAVAMGLLNSRNVFGVPALGSSCFNVGSLAVGLGAAWLIEPDFMSAAARAIFTGAAVPRDAERAAGAILGMAIGVLAGGALQFLVQAPSLRRTGFRFRPGFDLKDPGLRQVLALMGPAIIGTAAVQVNVFVNNNFASRLADGAVSWLNYSFRLMQFPIGVFGVAIATATLPAIARAAARQDRAEYRATLSGSLRLALFLTVPSAVGLIALARPIIALIYERGSFHADDTLATASALGCYAVGLVGYSCVKILAPAFYALDDARTPACVSLFSILVNLVLCWLLVGPLGHRGLALSTACVATANALLLALLLRARAGPLHGRALALCCLKVSLAAAALWAACRFSLGVLEAWLPGSGLCARTLVVLGSIAAGGLAYISACVLLRVEETRRLLRLLQRR